MTAIITKQFDDLGDPTGYTKEALENFGIKVVDTAKNTYPATALFITGPDDGGYAMLLPANNTGHTPG